MIKSKIKEYTVLTEEGMVEMSYDEYIQHIKDAIERSEEDIRNGRVMSIEECFESLRRERKVSITDEARKNLRSIHNYIATNSSRYADETERSIKSKIFLLELFPNMGKYVSEMDYKHCRN